MEGKDKGLNMVEEEGFKRKTKEGTMTDCESKWNRMKNGKELNGTK